MSNNVERIELRVVSPKTPLVGLDEANRKLLALQGTIDQINTRLSGLGGQMGRRSAAVLTDTLKQFETKVGRGQTLKKIAEVLGHDPKQVREYYVREQERMTQALAENERKRKQLRGQAHAAERAQLSAASKQMEGQLTALRRTFTGPQMRMTSAPAAGRFFEGFQRELFADKRKYENFLGQLFSGRSGGGGVPPPVAPATAAQVAAAVAQAGAALGGGRQAAAGSGSPAAATATATAAAAHRKGLTEFRKKMAAAEREMAEMIRGNRQGGVADLNRFQRGNQKLRLANQIEGLYAGLTPQQQETVTAQNAMKRAATLVTAAEKDRNAGANEIGKLRQKLAKAEAKADTEKQQALKKEIADLNAHQRAGERLVRKSEKEQTRTRKRQAALEAGETWVGRGGSSQSAIDATGLAAEKDHVAGRLARERAAREAARKPRATQEGRGNAEHQTWLARGMAGFSPAGFAKNLLSIGAWSAAVAALYQPIRLVTYSLGQMIEIGSQTARLSQVFRGVGGTARELTDDVLELAAANGRSSNEAIESAVAWSRLGLTRKQVNEAVRVSLVAANVAELDAGEATSHLSAIMAAYALNISELDDVLGMLNSTSNRFNVSNKDLLQGLSRTAAVAKQAGISFADLQGMIGAAVGRTGQSGANIGNAIKALTIRLGRADVQDVLQEQGIVTVGRELGDMKSMSQVLREVALQYMSMNDEERKFLTTRVAGAHQASRFVALLESSNQAQKLSFQSQTHLNSAAEENARIMATQRAQLAGIRAEWDRMVTRATLGGASLPAGLAGAGAGAVGARLAGFRSSAALLRFGGYGAAVAGTLGMLSGGSVNEQLMDLEHLGRNALRIGNLGPQLRERKPLLIERRAHEMLTGQKQTGTGSQFPQVMGQAALHPIRTANAMMDVMLGNSSGAFKTEAERLQRQMNREQAAAAAYGGESQRLRDQAKLLDQPNLRPGELKSWFSGEDATTQQLVQENRLAEAQVRLRQQAAAHEATQNEQLQASVATQAQLVGWLERELLIEKNIANTKTGAAAADAKNRVVELNAALMEARQIRRDLISDAEDIASGDPEGRRQATQNKFALTARLSHEWESIFSLRRSQDPVKQLEQENTLLKIQISLLGGLREQFKREGRPAYAAQAMIEEQALAAKLAAGQSIRTRTMVEFRREAMLGGDRARRGGVMADYGEDETERLLRQQSFHRQRVREIGRPQGFSDQSELTAHENRLEDIKQRLLERQAETHREINQLMVERTKEFRKSFLDAGPVEMLRKLVALRLAFDDRGRERKMDLGGYLALSPGMRGDLAQLNPNFDPRVWELNRERNRTGVSAGVRQPFSTAARGGGSATGNPTGVGPAAAPGTQAVTAAFATMNVTCQNMFVTAQNMTVHPGPASPRNPQSGGVGAGAGRS